MRYLREILNFGAYLFLLVSVASFFFVLRDVRMGEPMDWGMAIAGALGCLPWIALLVAGRLLSANFFSDLVFGVSGAGRSGGSREIALARDGRGKDAALGLIWRDRLFGDPQGLFTVLEMARHDRSLAPEAVQAANRLIASSRVSRADREHAGRLLAQARVSEVKESYRAWR
jgi:hypothetical protein